MITSPMMCIRENAANCHIERLETFAIFFLDDREAFTFSAVLVVVFTLRYIFMELCYLNKLARQICYNQ